MPRRKAPDPLAQAIGRRVRQLRLSAGYSRQRFLIESGFSSEGFLSDVERGLALPSLDVLAKFAAGLGVHVIDVLIAPSGMSPRERLVEASRFVPDKILKRWTREAERLRPPTPERPQRRSRPM